MWLTFLFFSLSHFLAPIRSRILIARLLQESGVCVRRLPQDITAHMYLNEDFVGGDFFFTPDATGRVVEKVIQPTCGRILGYSSGFENMHGVTALKSGQRCHITLWMTQDTRKIEELPLPEGSEFAAGRRIGPGRGIDPQ